MEEEPVVPKGNERLAVHSPGPLSGPSEKATSKGTKRPAASGSGVLSGPSKKAKRVLKASMTRKTKNKTAADYVQLGECQNPCTRCCRSWVQPEKDGQKNIICTEVAGSLLPLC